MGNVHALASFAEASNPRGSVVSTIPVKGSSRESVNDPVPPREGNSVSMSVRTVHEPVSSAVKTNRCTCISYPPPEYIQEQSEIGDTSHTGPFQLTSWYRKRCTS